MNIKTFYYITNFDVTNFLVTSVDFN